MLRGPGWNDPAVSSPSDRPPRSALGVRQLVGALLVLLPVILLFGGLSRCSFSPGGPSFDPAAGPSVDAPALLRDAAPRVPFVLRVPAVPPGWRSNAVDQALVDGGRVVRVGYLTGAGRYLLLVQSDAAEETVLRDAVDGVPAARGVVDVTGQRFVVYGGDEPAWVADVGGVRLLITGSGDEADFRSLATATLTGDRLPPGAAPR